MTNEPRANLRFLLLILPVNFLLGIDRNAMSIAYSEIQKVLVIDFVTVSAIVVASTWFYALLQIPAGWLSGRMGPRVTLGVACLVWSVGTLLTPMQTTVVSMLFARTIMGVGQSPDWSASVIAVSQSFPERRRRLGSALLLGSLYLGTALSGPLTLTLMAKLGWQNCFYLYGALGLVLALAVFAFYRDQPRAQTAQRDNAGSLRSIGLVLKNRAVTCIAMYYFCVVSVQTFFHISFVDYLIKFRHVENTALQLLLSAPWLVLYASVLGWGFVLRTSTVHRGTERFWQKNLSGLAALAAGLLLAGGMLCPGTVPGTTLMCLAMVFVGLCQVTIWPHIQAHGQSVGIITGYVTFLGNLAGTLVPIVMAKLVVTTGSWSSGALVPLFAALGGVIFWSASIRGIP
ncbi:MFS transporter [Pandoraea sputorum]|uniref:Putative glucarate transporter n=1 Tax=Pandoraea sputorum TaxID=93222 RepID=A0A5E5BMU6_9BURK|nr:MFS transporter [Pandoraea sputorum]VVE85630.1 putative glucarate transporter [Pandoraea sputorum]